MNSPCDYHKSPCDAANKKGRHLSILITPFSWRNCRVIEDEKHLVSFPSYCLPKGMLACILDQDNSTQKTERQRSLLTVCLWSLTWSRLDLDPCSDLFSDRSPRLLLMNTCCKAVALFPRLIFQEPRKAHEINMLLLGHWKSPDFLMSSTLFQTVNKQIREYICCHPVYLESSFKFGVSKTFCFVCDPVKGLLLYTLKDFPTSGL